VADLPSGRPAKSQVYVRFPCEHLDYPQRLQIYGVTPFWSLLPKVDHSPLFATSEASYNSPKYYTTTTVSVDSDTSRESPQNVR
jgi:hypothetical protein